MRHLKSLLVVCCLASQAAASQAPAGSAGASAGACSFLTRELAMKVSGAANKAVFDLPPEEEPAGKGSACHYADITLQIDPFTAERLEQLRKAQGKDWVEVPGVGDAAYFRDNGNRFAELYGRVGPRTFTIQLGVPFQGTAEGMKPNAITLAQAIVPRMR